MKRKSKQRTLKQTDYSVCAQCKQGKTEKMSLSRQVFFLSILPWLVAIILSYFVHSIFLIFIPAVGIYNMKAAKRNPLRRCNSCHRIQKLKESPVVT